MADDYEEWAKDYLDYATNLPKPQCGGQRTFALVIQALSSLLETSRGMNRARVVQALEKLKEVDYETIGEPL